MKRSCWAFLCLVVAAALCSSAVAVRDAVDSSDGLTALRRLQQSTTCAIPVSDACNATLNIQSLISAGGSLPPSALSGLCVPITDLMNCLNELVRGPDCGCASACKDIYSKTDATCISQVQDKLFCQFPPLPGCNETAAQRFAAATKRCATADQLASIGSQLGVCNATNTTNATAPAPAPVAVAVPSTGYGACKVQNNGTCNATFAVAQLGAWVGESNVSVLFSGNNFCIPPQQLASCLNDVVRAPGCNCSDACAAIVQAANSTCLLNLQQNLFCLFGAPPGCAVSGGEAYKNVVDRCGTKDQQKIQGLGVCGSTASSAVQGAAAPPAAAPQQAPQKGAAGATHASLALLVSAVVVGMAAVWL